MTPSDGQGQREDRDPEAHDDPTGMRALLSSLPDPGPMPTDLVERIEARLAVEQAHRAQQASSRGADLRSDGVLDLAAERSHRRPGRTVALLGVAAAGLLVATVTIGQLAGVGPAAGPGFDSAAQVPSRAGTDDAAADGADSAGGASPQDDGQGEMAAGGAEDLDASGDAAAGTEEVGEVLDEALGVDVALLPPLGVVTLDAYPEQVAQEARLLGTPQPASQGSLTQAGADACWRSVQPRQPWPTLGAAQAELDGARVVVLLGAGEEAGVEGESAILPWACTTGELVEPLHVTTWSPAP